MNRAGITLVQDMRFRHSFLVALLLAAIPAAAFAQEAPSPDASPVSNAPDTTVEEKPMTTLKVNVNLVSLYFTVRDKRGGLIPNLTKDDCNIAEDKTPQKIKNFNAESDLP